MEHDRNEHAAEPGKQERKEPEEEHRIGPTWRGLLIAVIAAVVLSVGATLLLGGTFGFTRQGASAGCGAGAVSDCCSPADSRSGGG